MTSATMQEVVDDLQDGIVEVGLQYMLQFKEREQLLSVAPYDPNIYIYRNSYQRSAYIPFFYHANEAVIDAIASDKTKDKWLIFVTSKNDGKTLCRRINEETGRKAAFLDSSKKDSAVWNTLVSEAKFKEDVLITTQVLDNGVNIEDSALKKIVLPFCDRVEMLQMLGRKRLQPGEEVRVYVKIPDVKTLRSKQNQVNRLMQAMIPFVEHDVFSPEFLTKELQYLWNRGDSNINRLFYIDDNRCPVANRFAYAKLEYLYNFYNDLLEHDKKPNYFPKLVRSWLGLDGVFPIYLMNFSKCATLKKLLEKFLGKPIYEDQQEDFYNDFQALYKIECKKLFDNDDDKYEQSQKVRKGKTQRKATMNRELAILGLPCEFKKKDNCWELHIKNNGDES